jgi:hypothetical protein
MNGAASNDSGVMDPQAEYDAWAQTPEGQQMLADAQAQDGPITSRFDDGTELSVYPDGSRYFTDTDGGRSLVAADGTQYSIAADGSRTMTLADGTTYNETQIRLAEQFGGSPGDYQQAFYQGPRENFLHQQGEMGTHFGINQAMAREFGFNDSFSRALGNLTADVDRTNFYDTGTHSSTPPGVTQDMAMEASLDRATQLGQQYESAVNNYIAARDAGDQAGMQQAAREIANSWSQFSHMRDDLAAHGMMSDRTHYSGPSPDSNRFNQAMGQQSAYQSYAELAGDLTSRGIDISQLDAGNVPNYQRVGGLDMAQNYYNAFYQYPNGATYDRVDQQTQGYLNDRYHENFFGRGRR